MTDQRRGHPETTAPPRIPPHDDAAERAILGAALAGYPTAIEAVLGIEPGDFYWPGGGHIAAAIGTLTDRGQAIDTVTVAAELERAGLTPAVGGPATLIELAAGGGIASNAPAYAELIVAHAATRRVLYVADEILSRGYAGVPAPDLIDLATRRLNDLPTTTGSTLAWADISAILANGVQAVEDTDLLARSDGRHLLYAGRIHFLQGEPTSGKGWVALAACLEVLRMGGTAVYLDLEDTDPGIIGRLLALGAIPHDIVNQFTLVRPTGPLTATELADLEHRCTATNPTLIVIDGLAEALANDDLDENSNADVTRWLRRVPRRLATTTGAAIIIIDHVTKSSDDRGRYARGAGAKLAALDGAAYNVIVRKPWSRVGPADGVIDLVISKDRHGGIGPTNAVAAHVKIHVEAAGGRVALTFVAPTEDEARGFLTDAMAQASAVVEANPGLSTTQLMTHRKPFAAVTFTKAIDDLVANGYITRERRGPGWTYRHRRPYPDGAEPQDAIDLGDWPT